MPKKEGNKTVVVCSQGGKITGTCKTCGLELEGGKITLKESVSNKSKEVEVIEKEDYETLPITQVNCDKCDNKEAYYWTVQTRAGDEPETKFLKCTKCLTTWRDYD